MAIVALTFVDYSSFQGVSLVEFRHHFQDDENPEHFCQMLPVTLTTLNLR